MIEKIITIVFAIIFPCCIIVGWIVNELIKAIRTGFEEETIQFKREMKQYEGDYSGEKFVERDKKRRR